MTAAQLMAEGETMLREFDTKHAQMITDMSRDASRAYDNFVRLFGGPEALQRLIAEATRAHEEIVPAGGGIEGLRGILAEKEKLEKGLAAQGLIDERMSIALRSPEPKFLRFGREPVPLAPTRRTIVRPEVKRKIGFL
jgi:hypothetical protein